MGSLVGHVAPGFAFFIIGLWHLFNHIKLHLLNPNSFNSTPWFPFPKFRYLELYLIIIGSSISISMELFIGPKHHHPFDTDWTIPSNHLHNFEHSSISTSFILYSVFAILLDKMKPKSQFKLTQLLGAFAFGQQLLIFYLHSTDHIGVEWQYHALLQILIFISLLTTLIGIDRPDSFLISFVRSVSILAQGAWLMIMGFMLWTPSLIPKGCFMKFEEGHFIVRCNDDLSLHRAKALANNEFSWFLTGLVILVMCLFIGMMSLYSQKNEQWTSISKDDDDDIDEDHMHVFEVSSSESIDQDLECAKSHVCKV